jgi:hypothetical protein
MVVQDQLSKAIPKIVISEDLWARASQAGDVDIGPDGRREIEEELNGLVRRSRDQRTWPLRAVVENLEAIRDAIQRCQGVIRGLEEPTPAIAELVRRERSRLNRKSLSGTDQETAQRAVNHARGAIANAHYDVISGKTPDAVGGYKDDEFAGRFIFDDWFVAFNKDLKHLIEIIDRAVFWLTGKDSGKKAKDPDQKFEAPRRSRREFNYPLLGFVTRARLVYERAEGHDPVFDNSNERRKYFVRWIWELMSALPDDVRPVSIDALRKFIKRRSRPFDP